MQKLFYPLSLFCLSIPLVAAIFIPTENGGFANPTFTSLSDNSFKHTNAKKAHPTEEAAILYQEIGLAEYGLSPEAFSYAYTGYQNLLEKNKISNTAYLTICDFSQSSVKKRLYIIDLENNQLLINTYVAHGRNSGLEYAKTFSNKPRSLQSSMGFFITRGTYKGKYGISLNLDGVEDGINNNALRRRIVLHGSNYVGEKYLQRSKIMGRSFGCPAVPIKESNEIINIIKDESCFFIYFPKKIYLEKSKILNG